jgi:hypothetical protein
MTPTNRPDGPAPAVVFLPPAEPAAPAADVDLEPRSLGSVADILAREEPVATRRDVSLEALAAALDRSRAFSAKHRRPRTDRNPS